MSLNINGIGEQIAVIKGGQYDGKIVCVSAEEDDPNGLFKSFVSLKLKKGESFQPFPNTHTERQIVFCSASSGAGKSYWVNQYLQNYKKCYPNRDIYVFSMIADDKSFNVKGMNYVEINEDLVSDPINIIDFKDSIVIFDDIDQISSKPVKLAVLTILKQICELGRHYNISCAITSHLMNKGNETKVQINESHIVTLFLKSGSSYNTYLRNYMGLSTKQIKRLKAIDSRWISIYRRYPNVVYSEREIILLDKLEDY